MSTRAEPNPYLKTKVMTAGPAELRMMLLDGAVKFAHRAHRGLLDKDYEAVFEGVTRCQAILLELINSLDPDRDPDLCRRLSGLYTFMYTRLMAASHERDPQKVQEVIDLLEYERQTWAMLMEKLAGDPPADPAAASGTVSVRG